MPHSPLIRPLTDKLVGGFDALRTSGGGGSGGVPDWAPAGANAYVEMPSDDFPDGRAWIANTTYDTLTGIWAIGEDGYGYIDINGPLAARLIQWNWAGVFKCNDADNTVDDGVGGIAGTDPNDGGLGFNPDVTGEDPPFPDGWYAYPYAFDQTPSVFPCGPNSPAGVHAIAVELAVGGNVRSSMDGRATVSNPPSFVAPGPLDQDQTYWGSPTKPAISIALYPDGQSDAQLQALSAS